MKYLLKYEDALEIVEKFDNFNFSKTETMMNGYKLVTFSYFLCDFSYFDKPLENKLGVNAYDMRGTTFILGKDNEVCSRQFMLPKFFNINQVEPTQYHLVKDKTIKSIAEKEDGSLIAFMILPNDTIFAKTIGCFDNEQTVMAMSLLKETKGLNKFVLKMLKMGYTPLFEYVSRYNRIVLSYSKPELRFIGLRDNLDGKFISSAYVTMPKNIDFISTTKVTNKTLDELIELAHKEENKEGWVIEFTDGQLIKVKTEWYCALHGIRTEYIFREDYVIKHYLNETLDDVLGQLDENEDADAFRFVDRIKLGVKNYIIHIDDSVNFLVDKYINFYKENWVNFATNEHTSAFFPLAKVKIEKPDMYNKRKFDFILNETKHLNKAKYFIDKWSGYIDNTIVKFKNRKDES